MPPKKKLPAHAVAVLTEWVQRGAPWLDGPSRVGPLRSNRNHARQSDQPMTALLNDLKSRGLLDETVVIWGGEFGRTPAEFGSPAVDKKSRFTISLPPSCTCSASITNG